MRLKVIINKSIVRIIWEEERRVQDFGKTTGETQAQMGG